jgi:hypothetical protein
MVPIDDEAPQQQPRKVVRRARGQQARSVSSSMILCPCPSPSFARACSRRHGAPRRPAGCAAAVRPAGVRARRRGCAVRGGAGAARAAVSGAAPRVRCTSAAQGVQRVGGAPLPRLLPACCCLERARRGTHALSHHLLSLSPRCSYVCLRAHVCLTRARPCALPRPTPALLQGETRGAPPSHVRAPATHSHHARTHTHTRHAPSLPRSRARLPRVTAAAPRTCGEGTSMTCAT